MKSHCDEFEDGVLGVLGEKGILFKDVASTRLGRVVINQIPQHISSIAILTERFVTRRARQIGSVRSVGVPVVVESC